MTSISKNSRKTIIDPPEDVELIDTNKEGEFILPQDTTIVFIPKR